MQIIKLREVIMKYSEITSLPPVSGSGPDRGGDQDCCILLNCLIIYTFITIDKYFINTSVEEFIIIEVLTDMN